MKCDGASTLIMFPDLAHISALVCSTALPDVSKNVHGLQKDCGSHILAYFIGFLLDYVFTSCVKVNSYSWLFFQFWLLHFVVFSFLITCMCAV